MGVTVEAFEEFFERQFDSVYGYLSRRVGPELGRDLASETFTRAFAGRKKFDPRRGEPRAWLFGIAHNLLRQLEPLRVSRQGGALREDRGQRTEDREPG